MKKFIGYTLINTKTKKIVEVNNIGAWADVVYEGEETFDAYKNKAEIQEILDEIDYYITHYNNKYSRAVKRNRKYFKIVSLYFTTK